MVVGIAYVVAGAGVYDGVVVGITYVVAGAGITYSIIGGATILVGGIVMSNEGADGTYEGAAGGGSGGSKGAASSCGVGVSSTSRFGCGFFFGTALFPRFEHM
jgi:hypothetical protein